ncbi:MAG TPA: hypothetical protein VKU60_18930 [Chloroflexota bacterium]|nr:hypothetical protein [Chloroflexota bacterium]
MCFASLFQTTTVDADPACSFVLGFASLASALSQVGTCLDNQAFTPTGDATQHTTGGLLVWRKADNWTAFSDGYHTWVNGPNGIQQRLNSERFPWEKDTPAASAVATGNQATPPSPAYTPPTAASMGLSGASSRLLDPPSGPTPTADDLASISVPPGAPPLASLPDSVKLACFNLTQDMRRSESSGGTALQPGDFLCPYASYTGWTG